jgi:hypothetical protein
VLSSACAADGRLTTPAPTKAKVHALYFIIFVFLVPAAAPAEHRLRSHARNVVRA